MGDWAELKLSYRMPPALIDKMREFADGFMEGDVDLPASPQMEFANLYPVKLKWVQAAPGHAAAACVQELLRFAPWVEPKLISMTDITFLSPSVEFGLDVVEQMKEKRILFQHTFDNDARQARARKQYFFMGDARFKATTIHSYKGWESRCLVIYIGRAATKRALSVAYTGMTRLKRHEEQSFMVVVSSVPTLQDYGRTWPEFEVFRTA